MYQQNNFSQAGRDIVSNEALKPETDQQNLMQYQNQGFYQMPIQKRYRIPLTQDLQLNYSGHQNIQQNQKTSRNSYISRDILTEQMDEMQIKYRDTDRSSRFQLIQEQIGQQNQVITQLLQSLNTKESQKNQVLKIRKSQSLYQNNDDLRPSKQKRQNEDDNFQNLLLEIKNLSNRIDNINIQQKPQYSTLERPQYMQPQFPPVQFYPQYPYQYNQNPIQQYRQPYSTPQNYIQPQLNSQQQKKKQEIQIFDEFLNNVQKRNSLQNKESQPLNIQPFKSQLQPLPKIKPIQTIEKKKRDLQPKIDKTVTQHPDTIDAAIVPVVIIPPTKKFTTEETKKLKFIFKTRAMVVHFSSNLQVYLAWSINKQNILFEQNQPQQELKYLEEIKKWRIDFNKTFLDKVKMDVWNSDFAVIENSKVTISNSDSHLINIMILLRSLFDSLKLSSGLITQQNLQYVMSFSAPGTFFFNFFHSEFVTQRLNPNMFHRISWQTTVDQTTMVVIEYFYLLVMLANFLSLNQWFQKIEKIDKGMLKVKTICSYMQDFYYEFFTQIPIQQEVSQYDHNHNTVQMNFAQKDWSQITQVLATDQKLHTQDKLIQGLYTHQQLYDKIGEKSGSMAQKKLAFTSFTQWIKILSDRINELIQQNKIQRLENLVSDLKEIWGSNELDQWVAKQKVK